MKKPSKKVQINSEVKKLKGKMKKQSETIEGLKQEIKKIKSELENAYHYEIIRQKEEKFLKAQLEKEREMHL